MYTKNNYPHGIMIHNLYDSTQKKVQGAISAHQLEKIILYLGDRLVNADQWMKNSLTDSVKPTDVCLTFDDLLLSQYIVALPVLEHYNIKAFFFINTCPLVGEPDKLELYKYFRSTFLTVQHFYDSFYDTAMSLNIQLHLNLYNPTQFYNGLHSQHSFYSADDLKFRYVRDSILTTNEYEQIIESMMNSTNFNHDCLHKIWMSRDHVSYIHSKGHVIGSHVHHHSAQYGKVRINQDLELDQNRQIIKDIIGEPPISISYPTDDYTPSFINEMKKYYKVGFRLSTTKIDGDKFLENGRYDVANLIKDIETENFLKECDKVTTLVNTDIKKNHKYIDFSTVNNPTVQHILKTGVIDPTKVYIFSHTRDTGSDVLCCEKSDVKFLRDTTKIKESFYKDLDVYRYFKDIKNSLTSIRNRSINKSDNERRLKYLSKIPNNHTWLDFGCGYGGLFSLVTNCNKIGVEVMDSAREALIHEGYNVFKNIKEVPDNSINIITLHHVFSHLSNPLEYLAEFKRKLHPHGTLIIETPNAKDVLYTSYDIECFKNFISSEHSVIHTENSLNSLLLSSGFKNIHTKYVQRYSLSNHMSWACFGMPGQVNILNNNTLNTTYESILVDNMQTDTLVITYSPT